MKITAIIEATEYATIYDKNIENVSFYIHEECVVISGLNKNHDVIDNIQLEISKSDFINLLKLLQ